MIGCDSCAAIIFNSDFYCLNFWPGFLWREWFVQRDLVEQGYIQRGDSIQRSDCVMAGKGFTIANGYRVKQFIIYHLFTNANVWHILVYIQSAQDELLWPAFVRRPSSCVVHRPSAFLLKHLLLWNRSLHFDQTSQEWSICVPRTKLFKPFQLVA